MDHIFLVFEFWVILDIQPINSHTKRAASVKKCFFKPINKNKKKL